MSAPHPPPARPGGEDDPATVILLRHGRSTANSAGILAGRSEGVDVDETGADQAAALVDRLAACRIARIVCSPILRCRSTVAPLAAALGLEVTVDERLTEVDYGDWTGRPIGELAQEPLWRTVQLQPSAAVFPNGEGLAAVSARAVAAARDLAGAAPASGALLICTHGDNIKSILADALGMHLDLFQRIIVSPASVSVIRYTPWRTFVERINDTGTLAGIGAPPTSQAASGAAEDPAAEDPAWADGSVPGGSAAIGSPNDAVVGGDPGVGS